MGISATIWALWYSSRLESQRRADDVGDEEDAKMYVQYTHENMSFTLMEQRKISLTSTNPINS